MEGAAINLSIPQTSIIHAKLGGILRDAAILNHSTPHPRGSGLAGVHAVKYDHLTQYDLPIYFDNLGMCRGERALRWLTFMSTALFISIIIEFNYNGTF